MDMYLCYACMLTEIKKYCILQGGVVYSPTNHMGLYNISGVICVGFYGMRN